ncbi:UNVERIFIED_CONTAM: hypothetical protein GTU68_007183 [Idotea baltica]|nr:hypothetical protein [Idotea baltica]
MTIRELASSAGIGFKADYLQQALATTESDLWLEVHTENYLVDGGVRLDYLEQLREQTQISFHGVSASLGGAEDINQELIAATKKLVDRFQPNSVSEHAVWSRNTGNYYPDLLPLPRTEQAMLQLVHGVSAYQEGIGRSILLENPTNYLDFVSEMDEPEFLIEAANRSGCGLLLDVNNLYLSGVNCGMNVYSYIDRLPLGLVGEIHVAGYTVDPEFGEKLYIDSHAEPVSEPVWELLSYALKHLGPLPVLVERDDNLPEWSELLAERNRAQSIIMHNQVEHAAHAI